MLSEFLVLLIFTFLSLVLLSPSKRKKFIFLVFSFYKYSLLDTKLIEYLLTTLRQTLIIRVRVLDLHSLTAPALTTHVAIVQHSRNKNKIIFIVSYQEYSPGKLLLKTLWKIFEGLRRPEVHDGASQFYLVD